MKPEFRHGIFKQHYIDTVCKLFNTLTGRDPDDAFRATVAEMYDTKIAESKSMNELIIHNPEKHTVDEYQTEEILDMVYSGDYTMSAYGVLVDSFERNPSPLSKFLIFLQDMRKAEKKLKFEHINDVDKFIMLIHDKMQLLFKLVGNSEYGGAGERNYILGSPNTGPGTTYNGFAIITSTIYFVESMMENNFWFFGTDDAIRYIEEVKTHMEKYPDSILSYLDEPITDWKIVFDELEGHIDEETPFAKNVLSDILQKLDVETLNRLYYTNNLYKFLGQKSQKELLAQVYSENFRDPNTPPDEIKDQMKEINNRIRMYVAHPYIHWNRAEIVKNLKRKSILVTDTDSVFCLLYNFILFYENLFHNAKEQPDEVRISIAMVANNILGQQLQAILDAVTGGLSVDKSLMPRINMKSEFLMKRLALTRNKKNYSSITLVQEGKVLTPPEFDIKGLPIKKSSTNRIARKYFSNLLKEQILEPRVVQPRSILNSYMAFEREVYTSLKERRDTVYLTPGKFTSLGAYKDPNKNSTVRAVTMWNTLCPQNKIQDYSRVNIVPIKETKNADGFEYLKEIDEGLYVNAVSIFKDHADMFRSSGVKAIALPKKTKSIPEFLLPLIDTDKIVEANLKSAYTIMESIGFVLLPSGNTKHFSSFIDL